jgi:lysophospholipase L1-like esterase
MPTLIRIVMVALVIATSPVAVAQDGQKWVASWTGSAQGPYPIGNPSAQPDQRFAFPSPDLGARDQTFRLVMRPDIWGGQARVRFTNVFGTHPVTLDGCFVGLQLGGPAIVKGTNQPITFGGKTSVTIEDGKSVWSDAVSLPFARDDVAATLQGRKLSISFHVIGETGPMTWHAKALQTSYVTAPGAGAQGGAEDEAAFPYSTASWFFVDAIEMRTPADTFAVVAFGDSITDGTASTMNGDDRWPDVLSRRMHARYGNSVAIINAGIGGNQIAGPAEYGVQKPFPGGPAAVQRLDRDVLDLSGLSAIIWFEGINDFSKNGNASVDDVKATLKGGVEKIRARNPRIRVIGATVLSALGSTNAAHGLPEQDEKRKGLNEYIRSSGIFDAVIDFDAIVTDEQTGAMKAEFIPESTTGGPGDKLHPNRAGYLAMGEAIDLEMLKPRE